MANPLPWHDLLLAYDFPPMGGGIARWMAAIADGYPAGALTVSTGVIAGSVAADAVRHQQVDRVPVPAERLRTIPGLVRWSRRASALARRPGARFVWCDSVRPAGYVARWVFERTALPYGIIMHGGDLLTLRHRIAGNPVKRRLMRSILGDAAVCLANSAWTAGRCRELLTALDLEHALARVRVVPLGTDPDRWRSDPVAAAAFRRRRGLPSGRWMVTVARLVDYKGIDTAIRVLGMLAAEHPDLHYAAIGRGPDVARLRALSAELGVADRVHLLNDVGDDELAAAYSIAEVYVGLPRETPADVEGFGIAFVEAAACGLPVVGTRSGGIPDAVADGETGLLFDPDDLAGLASGVDRLLSDPELARRMGGAGRQRVERYLNWNRVVSEMRSVAAELGQQQGTANK